MFRLLCKNCSHERELDIELIRLISNRIQIDVSSIFLSTIIENLQLFKCRKCNSKNIILSTSSGKFVEEGFKCNRCLNCDEQIPISRLSINLNAEYCVDCQNLLEQGELDKSTSSVEKEYCKRCGAEMVWRFRSRGGTGVYFLGCSRYPKCRYTISN